MEIAFHGHDLQEPTGAIKCMREDVLAALIASDEEGSDSLFHSLHWVPSVADTVLGTRDMHVAIDVGLPSRPTNGDVQHYSKHHDSCRPTEQVSPTCWRDRDTSLKVVGLSRVFQDT